MKRRNKYTIMLSDAERERLALLAKRSAVAVGAR